MASNDSSAAIVFVGILIWTAIPSAPKEEITVYYRYCSDFIHNVYSCPDSENVWLTKMKYKVSFDKQAVFSHTLIDRYKTCTVYDLENWECTLDSAGTKRIMREGNTWESDWESLDKDGSKSPLPRYDQIGPITYYLLSIKDFIKAILS